MTWQGKRRSQLPSNWASIRKQRLELDGYQCTAVVLPSVMPVVRGQGENMGYDLKPLGAGPPSYRCPARATEVDHHLDPHDHRLSSLRSLCAAHHREKTQREATAARAKVARKRQPQPHPGLR